MPEIPVVSREAVLAAVSVPDAIARVRDAFVRHRRGEWVMPSKVYLDSPGYGDFRAMPARGGDLAMLKWISSFPHNPERGLPTVIGVLVVNDATTSEPLAILDAGAVTALRTGAVAAVAAEALAAGRSCSVVGCGVNGAYAARALAAAGFGPGVCHDPDTARAGALAQELGWSAVSLREALRADVVTCVTPGHQVVVEGGRPASRPAPEHARRRRAGQGRGHHRCGRVVRAVLRRVGPGLTRRRADRRRRGRPRHPRAGDRPRRGCSPARPRAGRVRRP